MATRAKRPHAKRSGRTATKRRAISIAFVIVLVSLGFIALYQALTYHQSQKKLERAKSLQAIGQVEKAIKHYKDYLSANPSANEMKLELALLLERNNNEREALRLLQVLDNDLKYSENKDLKNAVTCSLYLHYGKLFDDCAVKANTCMKEKKYPEARSYYLKQQEYIKGELENEPGLDAETAEKKPTEIAKKIWTYQAAENIAHVALTYWLEGDSDKTNKVINQIPDWYLTFDINKDSNLIYSAFASLVENIAFEDFDKKHWQLARKNYQCALSYRIRGLNETSEVMIPVLEFDIGLTYYYQKMYTEAKRIFTQIKNDFPEYENESVRVMLIKCDKRDVDKSDLS
jgi:tetratricopeptide (TPR) repeat protein